MMPSLWTIILLLVLTTGQAEYTKYKDPSQPVEVRVTDLMSRMTLVEKIGQMTQIDNGIATDSVIGNFYIGSIVSGVRSYPSTSASAVDWVDMINKYQKSALSTRLGIPLIYGIDAVHGQNAAYNATIFPHNIGLGVTRDPSLLKKIGAATAIEVRATGIPYVFAPSIAVCRDPRWGRCYESYSEDHTIVQQMTEIISGLQGEITSASRQNYPFVGGRDKVVACAKHYVGDGGTQNGIDASNSVVNTSEMFSIHMPAYRDAVNKGVSSVMVSYSSWKGVKMHINHQLITGYLKNKLKFEGFTISDWEGIDRITSPPGVNYAHSVGLAINAGIDMVMVPYRYIDFVNNMSTLVHSKVVSTKRVNDAVRRILRVKFIMGLFESPYADTRLAVKLGCQEHRELAREAVRKSLVLLKNGAFSDKPLLPLPKRAQKILVAGTHADNLGYQCGGWTIKWQGFSGDKLTVGTTILSAIESTVDPTTEVVYSKNPGTAMMKASGFSYAIVVIGEHPYAQGDGDSSNLTLPEPGPTIIQNVCQAMKCVVVLVTGRPVVIEPYLPSIDALVAAWLPGSEGRGVTDVLFGDYGFTGKLARTWFRRVDQLPMNVGDEHYDPLFPFGFGLTTDPNPVADL